MAKKFTNIPQVDDEGGFIKFFKNLPQNDNDTVRVFDRGDWYTAHGDDASFIARTVSTATSMPGVCS
jgi:DNA mismatch repair protein MSH2